MTPEERKNYAKNEGIKGHAMPYMSKKGGRGTV